MLRHTFLHVPGLGAQTERMLWRQGCHTWDDFLRGDQVYRVGTAGHEAVRRTLEASCKAYDEGRHQFFRDGLGQRESWRAWSAFRGSCLYLDIETDGGMGPDAITCVGLYDGRVFRCLVKGEDLALFPDIVSHYAMVVTFFGHGFDIPVLKRAFPHFHYDHIHWDLSGSLRRLGYRGGLKRIERAVGIERPFETAGLTGRDAIRLWRSYNRGDDFALDTLVAYNREDVVNLERLACLAYERLVGATLGQEGLAHLLEGHYRLA